MKFLLKGVTSWEVKVLSDHPDRINPQIGWVWANLVSFFFVGIVGVPC